MFWVTLHIIVPYHLWITAAPKTPLQFLFYVAATAVQGTSEHDFAFRMNRPASASFMEDRATFPYPNAGAMTEQPKPSVKLCLNTSLRLLLLFYYYCGLSLT